MKTKLFFASCLLLLASCSCSTSGLKFSYSSNGESVTENRALRGFEKIEVNGSPTVIFTQADSFSVRVKGPENLLPQIITEVSGNTLVVRNKGKVGFVNVAFSDEAELLVYVTSPDIVGVIVNGSGDFKCDNSIDTDQMDIRLKGSGDIDINHLICDRCAVELIGSGDIDIYNLDTRETSASLVGSGDLSISEINAAMTRLSVRGSGDLDVEFGKGCGTVEADLQGSGDITLKGRVKSITQRRRGSGDINTNKLTVVD